MPHFGEYLKREHPHTTFKQGDRHSHTIKMGQNLITEFYTKVQTIKQGTLCMGMHYIESLRVSHQLPRKLTARVCRSTIITLRWSLGIPRVLQLIRQPELTNVNHCSF